MIRDPEARTGAFASILLSPITVLYLLFLLAPISYFLAVSFFKYSPAELFIPGFTTENYSRLLFDSYYRNVIYSTFRIAAVVTLISLVFAYALAYFLARMTSGWRSLLMFLIVAPLMTGIIVRTYGWIVLLGSDGLINRLMMLVGLVDSPAALLHREGTVIVALVHIMLPYMVFPIFSSLTSQDPHLVPAASTLGARPLRAFLEVTLPLSRSGIVMGSALVFTLTAGSVVTPQLLGGRDVTMMGQTIYNLVLSTFNWPLGAAVAALLVLTQFLVISLYFRKTRGAH
ncbi:MULTISPECIES: ABC transporter permease [unclassified Chelatococcus]|uniref:ABC transporter permease n=1 Tax=unclassified Chelatococcus TaxID=2638111 RepID=UPI001BD12392|nr:MULTISPECIES: ABC transporter permease [unclassified Chelatococcus]CAH1648373.1 ABC transporter permease [Hyphomicrobiales bacterium]MBS7741966.1 ABC transporter permease [Chelatococcus sp. HY11]MBX3541236.1 ABC transporter permease [Chelatococcus sp.]MCO5074871.1 ABC transporter permease [Chelatococcus sp.]CAH1690896.1 ABC transporter permease [Hyphomicrobiales bacterium]